MSSIQLPLVQQHTSYSCRGNKQRLGRLPAPENYQADDADDDGSRICYGTLPENDGCTGNSSRCCGCSSFDKTFQSRMFPVSYDKAPDEQHEQVNRQKNPGSSDCRSRKSGNQIADKCGSNDDRPRGNDTDSNSIEKLALGQPVILKDNSLMEERHYRQSTAERERPCHNEKSRQLPQKGSRNSSARPGKSREQTRDHALELLPASGR